VKFFPSIISPSWIQTFSSITLVLHILITDSLEALSCLNVRLQFSHTLELKRKM